MIIDGKVLSDLKREEIKKKVDELYIKTGRKPRLATILIGNDPSSETYVRMKEKTAKKLGIDTVNFKKEASTTEEMFALIDYCNQDPDINGILIQHPLPRGIDEQACFDRIDPEKDVDGVTSHNFGKMTMGGDALLSCTPKGIIDLIDHYNIEVEGKKTLVIGRSPILGKPVAMMLLNKNATVTIAHSKSKNLPEMVNEADIIVACVGKPEFIKKEWIRSDAILIDAGYVDRKGDFEKEAYEKAESYTPVPGGVGAMTITELMEQTVLAFENQVVNKRQMIKK